MNEKYLYELLVWIKEELRVAISKKDFERVDSVLKRIENEIGE